MFDTVGKLITSRRGFLIRASAITAAGATVAVPIITVADARARAAHHLAGLRQALGDLYPQSTFRVGHRLPEGWEADPRVMRHFPIVTIIANEDPEPVPSQPIYSGWHEYDRARAARALGKPAGEVVS